MIRVTVELLSANTGERTELARMDICNDGTSNHRLRNYFALLYRGRGQAQLDRRTTLRQTAIKEWPSEEVHIWNLVATMLKQMGYRDRRSSQVIAAQPGATFFK